MMFQGVRKREKNQDKVFGLFKFEKKIEISENTLIFKYLGKNFNFVKPSLTKIL